MSTYLACFIVCDFISKSVTINPGDKEFLFSVYATKEQIEKVDFSLEVGVAVTEYYIEYFGIDYPLPKLGKYHLKKLLLSVSLIHLN